MNLLNHTNQFCSFLDRMSLNLLLAVWFVYDKKLALFWNPIAYAYDFFLTKMGISFGYCFELSFITLCLISVFVKFYSLGTFRFKSNIWTRFVFDAIVLCVIRRCFPVDPESESFNIILLILFLYIVFTIGFHVYFSDVRKNPINLEKNVDNYV